MERSKWDEMGSAKPCGVCGKQAVTVTDDGWRCEEHRLTSLDEFAKLTAEERERLIQLGQGMRFSGSARRKLSEFATERRWSDEVLMDVLALARSGA